MRRRYNILPTNMKKSGLAMEYYVAMVLIIVFFIVLVGYTQVFGEELEQTRKQEQCRLSILENANLRLNGHAFKDNIICETENLVINEDLTKKDKQEQAKKQIADAMAICWNQYGEGKLNLFSGEGIFCSVCSLIEFKNPKTEKLTGFVDYFYSEKVLGRDETYSEYVAGVSKGDMFQDQNVYSVQSDVLNTSQTYAVMFYYPKGQDYIRKFTETIGASYQGLLIGGGAIALGAGIIYVGSALSMTGVGAVIGVPIAIVGGAVVAVSVAIGYFTTEEADEWAAFTFVLPYEKDKALANCTYLPVKQTGLLT